MAERTARRPSRRTPSRGSDRLASLLGGTAAEDPVARAQGSLDTVYNRLIDPTAPDVVKNDARSVVERVGSGSLGFLGDVLDVIDTPRAAVVSTVKEFGDAFSGEGFSASDWFQQTADNIGFGDVVGSTGNIWADRLIGFTGDVLLDPLTYASFGATAIAKPGLTAAARVSSREVAERLAKSGLDNAAARVTQRGVFAATTEELASIGVKKGIFFNVPGTGRVGRATARTFGAQAPKEVLVGGFGGNAVSAFADIGSKYLRQPVRRSKLYESAMKALSGKTGEFKLAIRATDSALEPEKILKAAEGLRQARLASGAAADYRRLAERELYDTFKSARAAGLSGSQLAKVLREGANETSATFRAMSAPQREVALRAQRFTAELLNRVNAAAGKPILSEADNYVFRLLTDEGRAALKKSGGRGASRSTSFGLAPMANARLTPGVDGRSTFLGEELLPPAIAGKSVEEQMMDLARAKFKDGFVQLFEDDWFKVMEAYIRGTSRMVGEYSLEKGLIETGVVGLRGVQDDPPFLPNGRVNPTHPIQRLLDTAYAAIDEGGGAVWLQYIDDGMADMVAAHNSDRLEALGLVYGRRFGEDLNKLDRLRDSMKAWVRAQEFYRAELQSVLSATPESPTIPQLLEAVEEADGKVEQLLAEITQIESAMDLETQRKMAAVLAKRNKAQRLLTDRPSRDAEERAARLVEQADQEEALLQGRYYGPYRRPDFETARAENAETIGVLEQELLLTNERNVRDSLQRPAPPATPVTRVDPTDMPMSTARRFENTVAFGEGADEINEGLAGVRADYPTAVQVALDGVEQVRSTLTEVGRQASAIAVAARQAVQVGDMDALDSAVRAFDDATAQAVREAREAERLVRARMADLDARGATGADVAAMRAGMEDALAQSQAAVKEARDRLRQAKKVRDAVDPVVSAAQQVFRLTDEIRGLDAATTAARRRINDANQRIVTVEERLAANGARGGELETELNDIARQLADDGVDAAAKKELREQAKALRAERKRLGASSRLLAGDVTDARKIITDAEKELTANASKAKTLDRRRVQIRNKIVPAQATLDKRAATLEQALGVQPAIRSARDDVRSVGRDVRAADRAEQASLRRDTRRVQSQIRGANRANVTAAGRTDRQLARTERQLAATQAKVLTPRQQQLVEQQLAYRRQAQQLFDYADTYYAEQPFLRDSLRLQAQANVAYADLLERGLNPLRVEDVKKALTGPNGEDIRDQVLWALHEGMKRLGQKSVAVGEPWVQEAVVAMSRVNSPEEIGNFFRLVDKVSTFWKAQAVFSPGFHVRNFMGGMWNNYLGGIEMGAYRRWYDADRQYQALVKKFDGDVDLARAAAREQGGLVAEVAEIEARGMVGGADKTLQDFSGLTGGVSRLGAPFRLSQRVGANVVERNLRGALALDVISKGGSYEDALEAVVKYHFDYSDLSRFEEKLRRVIPFYTWMRHNFPLQVEAIIKQPGKVNRYMTAKRNLEMGMEEEGIVPHWFGEQLAIRLPFSMDGSAVYTMPALPFKDLRLVSDLDRLRKGDVSGFAAQANPFLKAPIEATLGRQFFGKIPFNEGLQEVPRYVTVVPGVPQALAAFGVIERGGDGKYYAEPTTLFMIDQFLPVLGQSRRLLPNEPRLQERGLMTALNFTFGAGLRVNSPTEQANELYRRRRALLDMEQRLETSGYVMPTYGIEIRVPNDEYTPTPGG